MLVSKGFSRKGKPWKWSAWEDLSDEDETMMALARWVCDGNYRLDSRFYFLEELVYYVTEPDLIQASAAQRMLPTLFMLKKVRPARFLL